MAKDRDDIDHDEEAHGRFRRFAPFIGFGALLVIGGGGLFAFVSSMQGSGPPPQPEQQVISLVVPPPPPPPPPQQEPPPPEEKMEEVETPEPEPEAIEEAEADEPPPAEGADVETGIEGAGSGGMKLGGGGRGRGAGGDPRSYWAGQIARDLQRVLSNSDEYRKRAYNLQVRIWFKDDGRLADLEIERGSGDSAFDGRLKEYLLGSYRRPNAPPEEMQPVLIRIRAQI